MTSYLGTGLTAFGGGNLANLRGAWASGTPYAVGDLVTYSNRLYECTTAVGASGATLIGAGSAVGTAGNGSNVVTLPSGSIAGDLLLLILSKQNNSGDSALIPPSGYTTVTTWSSPASSADSYAAFYSYVLQAADITAGAITIPVQTHVNGLVSAAWTFRNGVVANYSTGTGFVTSPITPAGYPAIVVSCAGNTPATGTATLTCAGISGLVSTKYGSGGFMAATGYDNVASGASPARTFALGAGVTDYGGDFQGSVAVIGAGTFQTANFTEVAAIHDSSGRLQCADPSSGTDVVNVEYLASLPASASPAFVIAMALALG